MKLLILISVESFEMTGIDRSNSLSGQGRDKNKNLGPDQERENLRHQGRQCPWSPDSKKNS